MEWHHVEGRVELNRSAVPANYRIGSENSKRRNIGPLKDLGDGLDEEERQTLAQELPYQREAQPRPSEMLCRQVGGVDDEPHRCAKEQNQRVGHNPVAGHEECYAHSHDGAFVENLCKSRQRIFSRPRIAAAWALFMDITKSMAPEM